MSKKLFSNLILVFLVLFTCPISFAFDPIDESIFVDEEIRLDRYAILKKDFQEFHNFQWHLSTHEPAREVLRLESLSSLGMKTWLKNWVHFIVPTVFTDRARTKVLDFHYNSHVDTHSDLSLDLTPDFARDSYFMLNYGLIKYLLGVERGLLVGLYFLHDQSIYSIPVHSPAVGVVQLGSDFFSDEAYLGKFDPATIDPLALSMMRISTLYHEAAHSRGRGVNAGFRHVKCPANLKIYAGLTACDVSLNSGNGIKAHILLAAVSACSEMRVKGDESMPSLCKSSNSLDLLSERANDSLSRVLTDEMWDEASERIVPSNHLMKLVRVLGKTTQSSSGNKSGVSQSESKKPHAETPKSVLAGAGGPGRVPGLAVGDETEGAPGGPGA